MLDKYFSGLFEHDVQHYVQFWCFVVIEFLGSSPDLVGDKEFEGVGGLGVTSQRNGWGWG
jgi:hypothetical protein